MEKQQLEDLLKEMSLEEKVGQLFQIIGYYYVEEGKKFITGPDSGLKLSDENGALFHHIQKRSGLCRCKICR